jgi:phosphoglycolate phosphatase-like HAD superfamily hydrolase
MSESVTAVLFDVDGTLVDSNYLLAVTWWEAFSQAGHDVAMADIHRTIGMGSDLMLDEVLPSDRDTGQDDSLRTAHSALYSTYSLTDLTSDLMPGAVRGTVILPDVTGM